MLTSELVPLFLAVAQVLFTANSGVNQELRLPLFIDFTIFSCLFLQTKLILNSFCYFKTLFCAFLSEKKVLLWSKKNQHNLECNLLHRKASILGNKCVCVCAHVCFLMLISHWKLSINSYFWSSIQAVVTIERKAHPIFWSSQMKVFSKEKQEYK